MRMWSCNLLGTKLKMSMHRTVLEIPTRYSSARVGKLEMAGPVVTCIGILEEKNHIFVCSDGEPSNCSGRDGGA
jgi:hypothetical protein